jgi:hypothetical protein
MDRNGKRHQQQGDEGLGEHMSDPLARWYGLGYRCPLILRPPNDSGGCKAALALIAVPSGEPMAR